MIPNESYSNRDEREKAVKVADFRIEYNQHYSCWEEKQTDKRKIKKKRERCKEVQNRSGAGTGKDCGGKRC